jgi:hypothetical protein
MSEDPLAEDLTNVQIQRLTIRAHMEAKQLQDLRRDIARNLRPSDGPYSPGDKVFFSGKRTTSKSRIPGDGSEEECWDRRAPW